MTPINHDSTNIKKYVLHEQYDGLKPTWIVHLCGQHTYLDSFHDVNILCKLDPYKN
jgi:hypothetical protein